MHPTISVIENYIQSRVNESKVLQQRDKNQLLLHQKNYKTTTRRAWRANKLIAEGSFSQVFAVQPRLHTHAQIASQKQNEQQRLVLKQIHPTLASRNAAATSTGTQQKQQRQEIYDQATADLMLEALYLTHVQHPHIVSVHAMSDSSQDFFVILEECPTTLAAKIMEAKEQQKESNNHTFSSAFLRYVTQLASSLQYLHSHRIILRDLKPNNVGISQQDAVKLMDFGCCRELPSTATSTSSDEYEVFHMTQVGTIRYCAPEVLVGNPYNDKCDVYALALILYQLQTLQVPYASLNTSAASQQDHIQKVGHGGKRPGLSLYQVCPEMERIIRKSWQRSLQKRWSAQQVYQALLTHTTTKATQISSLSLQSEASTPYVEEIE